MVSLIITTYNRAEQLQTALLSVCAQSAEPNSWECIVVNNNSSDNTNQVANEIIENHPQLTIRLVEERKQGLSHARNCGVEHSRGEVVIFVDDDEIFSPEFLSSYITFFNSHPEVSVAGGGCEPLYQTQRPHWMSSIVEQPIAFPLDMGSKDRPFPKRKIPGGGNLAFRRSVITQNLFNPKLGRTGASLIGGEEVELLNRLRKNGESIWWVAGARMFHIIPDSKLQRSYLERLWFNIGVSQRKRAEINGNTKTLYIREAAKWCATIIIALSQIITLNPAKAKYLILMRLYISRGLASD